MEAMRQNMTRLQDMLRQMQEQQQACTASSFPSAIQPTHNISSTTPSAQPERNTAQGAPSWLPPNQPGLGAPPCSQGPQFDFANAAPAPTARPQAPTPGIGTNQAPNQAAMAWPQATFDPSMAAHQASPIGAGPPNVMAQSHAQAQASPFATPYPQQAAVNRAGGEKGLPLSGGIKIRPIPPQFKFPPVPRYSGETDLKEFLSIYESAIKAAHGDENTKAKVIHLALDGIAHSWYFNLPANSIYSWEQLRDVFVLNFRGTYEEPKTQQHLLVIRQRPGESIREYMRRFSQARCQVQDITEASVINAASIGLLEDAEGIMFPHQDPLVISAEIASFEVRRILVDGGTSADVIFAGTYAKMGLPTLSLTQAPVSLRGFGGEAVQVLGQAQLLVAFGTGENRREEQILFDMVDIPYNYNAIFGGATLNKFEAISHHNYLELKMPGLIGVIVVKGLQASAASKGDLNIINRAVHNVEAEPCDRAKHAPKPAPHGKIIKMQIDDANPTKLVSLGGDMGEEEVKNILEVLKKNIDIFTWGPDEVGGVSTDLIMHHLAVKPDAKPRKQKLRKMSADRQAVAKAEVQKLLKAGACSKDDFPLPRIDQLVDSTAGCELMSFLDAYSGYHQIHMNPADIPKTAFIIPFGTFCHLRMPFGLRNAGATFARLVYKVLYKHLGRNVEAYVDDIVVKSHKAFDHASDLQVTFDNLRAAGMKLNPEKCVFGVRAGKLLGFLVSKRGIEANPEKIDAIQQMKPPSSVREVQKLTDRIAALSRFLSKAAERVAVSAALVQETESGQKLVYFVFEALQGAKTRYIKMEKLAYALVMASRKLKHYFQAQKVTVPSQYPLGEILRGKEVTGRLSKWAAELSPFDLHFVARTAVKSQVLADFVAEWTPAFAPEPEPVEQPWMMYFDGSWSHKGAGIAAILTSPGGVPIQYAARLQFDTTNNAAEYEAILVGLKKAKALGVRRLLIRTDSKLVAGHVDKSFEAKEEGMKRYLEAVRSMEKCFADITVEHLPRGQNEEADALAKSASCGAHIRRAPFSKSYMHQARKWRRKYTRGSVAHTRPQEQLPRKYFDKQVQKCKSCQRHGRSQTAPQYELQPIAPIWPFARWGLDIIGPFPVARNGYKFAIVAVKYFSRWIEAKPLGAITSAAVQKFVWKNIVCRFGVPKEFITDNGKQFDSDKFREMCKGLNLEIRFASVAHPQSNGAAERTNGKILEALKKRLEGAAKGKWLDEMLSVLWALRTTPTRPTKFSPFMLLYGDEAMTRTKLGANSPRVMLPGAKKGARCHSNYWKR
uniref:Retrotransposon protein, putative, Ty3-gypsy subclass n=1 Tax=Oryza sativa subsp. japonica TaxID=39947 RepID=Q2QWA8_ORYSJ|nr:retrotransposon protein, putative, Ty3-gypsy subclass [Oryza sativa Japonica Group]